MEQVTPFIGDDKGVYYLVHHPMIKLESSTMKVRPVFDPSTKATTRLSLNDKLRNGPKLEDDLAQILLKWRKSEFAVSANIEKMFRVVKVQPWHRNFQPVLYRPTRDKPVQE